MSRAAKALARPATADDVGAVADLLTDAFADYPWTNWAVPADDHRRRLHTIYEIHSAIGAHRGDLWLLEVDGMVVSAAAWTLLDGSVPPSDAALRGVPRHLVDRMASELPAVFGDRLDVVARAEAATLDFRPSGPYWFLDCVGTAPGRRGRGHASEVITAALNVLDRDRLPCAVETSTEANVRLYERLGFGVTERLDVGDNAPPVWVMTRPAVASSPPHHH